MDRAEGAAALPACRMKSAPSQKQKPKKMRNVVFPFPAAFTSVKRSQRLLVRSKLLHGCFFMREVSNSPVCVGCFFCCCCFFFNKMKTDAGAFLGTVLFSSPQQQHHIQKKHCFFVFIRFLFFFLTLCYCEENFFRFPPSLPPNFVFFASVFPCRILRVFLDAQEK